MRGMSSGAGNPRHRLDEVIHSPVRLCVVSALSGVDRAEFRAVRDAVDVSDSVLSKAVARLEEAGYVAVAKDRRGRRPTTYLRLTADGATALQAHLAALEAITGGARASRAGTPTEAPTGPVIETPTGAAGG